MSASLKRTSRKLPSEGYTRVTPSIRPRALNSRSRSRMVVAIRDLASACALSESASRARLAEGAATE